MAHKTDSERRKKLKKAFGGAYTTQILTQGGDDYNSYIDAVKAFVERRARDITTSQLRNIFSQVKVQQAPAELHRLRPKLAYVAGRTDDEAMRELVVLLDDLIKEVDSADTLKAFQDFFEAVIAYHRYYNPKGN